MKYDCSDEFDLADIYRKLTAESAHSVKACDFFDAARYAYADLLKQTVVTLANIYLTEHKYIRA